MNNLTKESISKNDLDSMSSLVLAYLGDTVYETYVRNHLILEYPKKKVNELNKMKVNFVKAKAQADIILNLLEELSEKEVQIYKRGRNQKSATVAKNADIIDYRNATGFEALIGYLYLDNNYDRLEYIMDKGMNIIQSQNLI
ncbi:MAG: Mini-ribonuclease 3 [Clostridioides sp.]|jgi:ribonuclease-3 family protein|nr:Mini-ribonuclease 3 [Clostridioides sp.]